MQSLRLRVAVSTLVGSLTACACVNAADGNSLLDLSLEELVQIQLFGKGEVRQVQAISRDDTRLLLPGTSPLKVIAKLPGVLFVAADAYGNYEWSEQLAIRGFRQDQLGYTLDGIPLGDHTYSNNNGLHISRALIAENLQSVELAQGSGAVSTASSSNLGGTLRFVSREPEREASSQLAQTIGSDATRRSYARWDSGERAGLSTTFSAVDADAHKWKGSGRHEQFQINSQAVYRWGEQRISAFYNASRRKEADYMDLSLDSQQRLGWDWDYYSPDWDRAVAAANGQFTGDVSQLDDAYFGGRGLRKDELAGLAGEFSLGQGLQLTLSLYHHHDIGQGHWHTPYFPSSPTVPISLRTTEYLISRSGANSVLSGQLGRHDWQAGLWFENNRDDLSRNLYFIDGPERTDYFFTQPDLRIFSQHFETRTLQLHVRDRMQWLDGRLQIDLGVKSLNVETQSSTRVGTLATGRLQTRDHFLPQAGARYRFSSQPLEAFFSYSENLAAFNAGRDGPFNVEQAAFDASADRLRPESSKTLEAGLRYSGERASASVAAYKVTFDNRLLAIAQCTGIVGCTSAFANVGTVDTHGVELTARWRPLPELVWLNTLSFNDSRYRDDYLDGTDLVPTADRQVVNTPRRLFSSELTWQTAAWSLRLAAKFTDRRYVTYTNDTQVPSFWLLDGTVAYQLPQRRWFSAANLQLNISNLLNARYFATVGSNGFAASDPSGQQYTLQAGAPRQVFVTLSLGF